VKTPVIAMKHVNYAYEQKNVLQNVNFELPQGAFLGLAGPNGGGKTTLIRLILGLIKPDSGSIRLFNEPIETFRDWTKIGYVSQKSNAFNKEFPATVYEVVSMGLTAKVGYLRFFTKKHKAKILEAIEQVGMLPYARHNIGELSGGQQQRVFIARALVSEPELMILDEPAVGVDAEHVRQFYQLLNRLNKEHNLTLLLITHDTDTMTKHVTDIACLNKQLHFHGTPEAFLSLSEADLADICGRPVNTIIHDH